MAAAESLIYDHDLVLATVDRERYEERRGEPPEGLHVEPVGEARGDRDLFAHHWLYSLLLAPWLRLAPVRGPAMLNGLLLVAAAWLAARLLERRLGAGAPSLVAVATFCSIAPALVVVAQPGILYLATTIAAIALVGAGERPVGSQLPDVYPEDPSPWRGGPRVVLAGVLATLPACLHPIYLLVPLAVAGTAPRGDRRRCAAAVGLGALLLLACLAGVRWTQSAPAFPWTRTVTEHTVGAYRDAGDAAGTAAGGAVGRRAGALAEGRIEIPGLGAGRPALWSAVYLFLGRSVGLLPYFLPFVLLIRARESGRHFGLVVAALGGALLFAVLTPFDFAGYVATPGHWLFLPFYGLLWFVPGKLPRRAALVVVAFAAGAVLWPSWLDPYSVRPRAGQPLRPVASWVGRLLPVETTLRDLSRTAIDGSKVLRVMPLAPSIAVIGGRDLEWRRSRGAAALLVAAPPGLDRIFLDFDKNGGSELKLKGGEVVETLYRPNGRIGTVIDLAPGGVEVTGESGWWRLGAPLHATAASSEPTRFFVVRFEMEDAKSDVVRFRCSADTVGG